MKKFLPLIFLATTALAQESKPLQIGDPAPELKIGRWVQGDAVEKFEPGKTYVVEFWATWCGPCRTSIPHLNDIAKKYAEKAKVIGVSVWEREKDEAERMKKIGDFVNQMGDKMSYRVAADTNEGDMAEKWMKAAGQRGIPSAFIVDGQGRIAWIGHPMSKDFESSLDQIIQAKFDVKAFAEQRAKERASDEAKQSAMATVQKLAREGKPAEALAALDKVIAEQPTIAAQLGLYRLNLLQQADPAAAVADARKLADGEYKDNWRMLSSLARIFSSPQAKDPNLKLAQEFVERAQAAGGAEDPIVLSQFADLRARQGDSAGAIGAQEKALAALEQTGTASPQIKAAYQRKLEEYRSSTPPAK
jgi:thiol-disulfide isomerase/thioredoxin